VRGVRDPGGVAINWVRMVAVRARRWRPPASVPAARVRLWAIAAQASQAGLAVKIPDGRCARGPFLSSAMTCSTMAWSRWVASAGSVDSGELVNTAW